MTTNAESHLPIDKSVILPPAVRAAAAAADAMMSAALAPPPGGPPPPAGFVPQETPPVSDQAPPPPPSGGPPPPAGFTQHVAPQLPPAMVPAQVTPPNGDPPPAEPGSVEGQWQRRAMSWRGQIEADRAAHQREIAGFRAEIDNLRAQLTGSAPAGTAPGGSRASAAPVALAIDPAKRAKLVETWGEEMVEAMEGVARDMAGAAMGQVAHQVHNEIGMTRDEIWARENAVMMTTLDQLLPGQGNQPGWRIVNDDPDFKSWLQQQDGFSRLTKHQVLLDAWQKNDTQTVHQIFAAYMGQLPQGGPGTVPPAPHQGGVPQPSNRLPMQQFAAPGPARPAGHGAPVPAEVNQYTPSQIAVFFQQKARGVYNDTPARQQWAAAIEADIFAAQREGRVVPG